MLSHHSGPGEYRSSRGRSALVALALLEMQVSAKEREKLRANLASRKSFFGGSLSTAGASQSAAYVAASARIQPEAPKPRDARDRGGEQRRGSSEADTHAAEPQTAPRKVTAADYAAFEALAGNSIPEPRKSCTPPVSRPRTDQAAIQKAAPVASRLSPAAAQRPSLAAAPRLSPVVPRSSPAPQKLGPAAPRLTSLSRHSPPRRPPASPSSALGVRRPQIKQPPGRKKKGQATRQLAVAPQAAGGPTRRQKADIAWASQLAGLRGNGDAAEPKPAPTAGGHQKNLQPWSARPQARTLPPQKSSASRAMGFPQQRMHAKLQAKPQSKLLRQQQHDRRAGAQPSAQQRMAQPRLPQNQPPKQTAASLQSRSTLNLAGKDLSKLPDWQRTILEKRLREELRLKRQQEEEEAEEDGSGSDDFVVDDDEGDWRDALKTITGYDPSRFKNERFDDRSMEADWRTIQAEERRSARLGRTEDDCAEAEEASRQKQKAARKRSKNGQSFLLG